MSVYCFSHRKILLKSRVIYPIYKVSFFINMYLTWELVLQNCAYTYVPPLDRKLDMMSDEMLFKYSEYVLCHTYSQSLSFSLFLKNFTKISQSDTHLGLVSLYAPSFIMQSYGPRKQICYELLELAFSIKIQGKYLVKKSCIILKMHFKLLDTSIDLKFVKYIKVIVR